jgi:hypothetical protein
MAFTKTYQGSGSNDYSNSLAWALNSLRDSRYAWTASGSGTAEYYVRTAANANPGFAATPPTTNGVYLNGTSATKATLGSLAAGNWGFGDNDALGYSTVYVRTSGGVDPDTLSADYVQFRQIPQAGEYVRIPAGAGSITTASGLDQSAVSIEDFHVEEGYDGTIGSATGFLRISLANNFYFKGTGQAFIDLGGSSDAFIYGTASASTGEFGLYLRGTALSLVDVQGGSVGIAVLPGETSTLTTLRMSNRGTTVKCGAGVTLTSALPIFEGNLWLHCNATTVTKYGGNVYLREAAAITTVNSLGPGSFSYGSSGNITTYNNRGGSLDMRASNASRTLTTLNLYTTSGSVSYNKEAVTITNHTMNDSLVASYGA